MPKRTRDESPQKQAMREMMQEYLKNNRIRVKDGQDVKPIMRDMMSVILEGAMDGELDEELGYSNMIIETRKPITVVMAITQKPCTLFTETWRLMSPGIATVNR